MQLVSYCVIKPNFFSIGPLHRKPAVSGPQQAVGCHCWVPSRLRPHDDEAGTGTKIITFITPLEWKILICCTPYKQNPTSSLLCCGFFCLDWAYWPHVSTYWQKKKAIAQHRRHKIHRDHDHAQCSLEQIIIPVYALKHFLITLALSSSVFFFFFLFFTLWSCKFTKCFIIAKTSGISCLWIFCEVYFNRINHGGRLSCALNILCWHRFVHNNWQLYSACTCERAKSVWISVVYSLICTLKSKCGFF